VKRIFDVFYTGENGFVEVSKNLDRSENNFVRSIYL